MVARHYIDLFVGPGKCVVPKTGSIYLGSPLLSLTTSYPFTGYFFVEMDPENVAALQQRCSNAAIHDQIQFLVGDCNVKVREIVERIQATDSQHLPGKWSSLNLAFLDPAGLDLRWDTVATLAQPYTMDLIIHYPQGGLNRYMGKACESEELTKVDFFFGGSEWREIYKKCRDKQGSCDHRQLMDLYKDKLQRLNYKEVFRDDEVGDEPLMRNAKEKSASISADVCQQAPVG